MWAVCNRCTVCNVTYDLLRLCKKGRTTAPICHLLLIFKRPWGGSLELCGVSTRAQTERKSAFIAFIWLWYPHVRVVWFFFANDEVLFCFSVSHVLRFACVSESGLNKFSIAVSYLPYNKIGLTVTRYAQTVFPFKYHQRYTCTLYVYTLYVYYNQALDVWNLKSWIN